MAPEKGVSSLTADLAERVGIVGARDGLNG